MPWAVWNMGNCCHLEYNRKGFLDKVGFDTSERGTEDVDIMKEKMKSMANVEDRKREQFSST